MSHLHLPSSSEERVERALRRLRPLERDVLLLAAREGLSNADIAARLGIPVGRAERMLARALAKLDRLLAETPS